MVLPAFAIACALPIVILLTVGMVQLVSAVESTPFAAKMELSSLTAATVDADWAIDKELIVILAWLAPAS
jgi:hypothetical protein